MPSEKFAEQYCESPALLPAFSLRGCIAWHRLATAGGFPLALFGLLGILALIPGDPRLSSSTAEGAASGPSI